MTYYWLLVALGSLAVPALVLSQAGPQPSGPALPPPPLSAAEAPVSHPPPGWVAPAPRPPRPRPTMLPTLRTVAEITADAQTRLNGLTPPGRILKVRPMEAGELRKTGNPDLAFYETDAPRVLIVADTGTSNLDSLGTPGLSRSRGTYLLMAYDRRYAGGPAYGAGPWTSAFQTLAPELGIPVATVPPLPPPATQTAVALQQRQPGPGPGPQGLVPR